MRSPRLWRAGSRPGPPQLSKPIYEDEESPVHRLKQGLARLNNHASLPLIRVHKKCRQQARLDRGAQSLGRIRMQPQPMVPPKGVDHLFDRHRAVFHGDAGVLRLRTFLVHGVPHQAGQQGRGRRAVVDGSHRRLAVATPPGARSLQRHGVVAAGADAFTQATLAQAGVQIDPRQMAEPAGRGGAAPRAACGCSRWVQHRRKTGRRQKRAGLVTPRPESG